ncbi:MAG: PD-(D/E)XK nuclease family protein [Propionibacteriaceae bacterium]|nr:PD-(D/E)XK nuclease family protein [Propionibacteriaceae bacterium]
MRPVSRGEQPVVAPGSAVDLSGSQLGSVLACPRHWFLARKAQAESARGTAASFGSVVHVLAEHGARAETDPTALSDHLESVWDQLDFEANWLSAVERVEAETALERFAAWQEARPELELLGTEVPFSCDIDLDGGPVHLTGTADRVERDSDGRIRIVDFKTSKTPPAAADVAMQDQLGVYQLAVQAGAFDDLAGSGARPGGAELVYLRLSDGPSPLPKVFQQPSLDDVPFPLAGVEGLVTRPEPVDLRPEPAYGPVRRPEPPAPPTWVHQRLAEAAHVIRSERFEARIGSGCRYCPFRGSCPAQPSGRQVVT